MICGCVLTCLFVLVPGTFFVFLPNVPCIKMRVHEETWHLLCRICSWFTALYKCCEVPPQQNLDGISGGLLNKRIMLEVCANW